MMIRTGDVEHFVVVFTVLFVVVQLSVILCLVYRCKLIIKEHVRIMRKIRC